jgi:enoyl-CoA hydratase/carnithine racemase
VGADLTERMAFTQADLIRHRPTIQAAYFAVRHLPVPAIAAVAGYGLGGGLELALACDLVVADATAMFGLPEVSLGLLPGGGGTQLLARRVGPARAADLNFTGRRFGIDEAEPRGAQRQAGPSTGRRGAGRAGSGRRERRLVRHRRGAGLAARRRILRPQATPQTR